MAQSTEPARRERLNRARVLDTAVAMADEGGFEALSMRKLAERLGVVPMALYKHVADKDELLDGMVDLVFAEVEVPSGGGWRTAMRVRATSMRDALRRHPWAIGRMETGTPGPANLRHHNAVLACLRHDAGFPFRTAVHAYSLMDSYIYGFALQDRSLAGDIPKEAQRRREVVARRQPAAMESYPYLIEVAEQLAAHGYDHAREFEFGLDLILDGIAQLSR
ncbi:MAG TPA: TetR/AcrR family transcriptional regulator C-terminal domain-containing protein [Micromonosporaceae bacterium]|nr:TetR/AcrR family transcriptional regulator C-terminal domain-containing protein [Micromonosporaceae bacterium]